MHSAQTFFPFAWRFLSPHKKYIFLFIICTTLSGLFGVINPNLIKIMINKLESANSSAHILSLMLFPAIAFVVNFEIHNLTWRGMGWINYKIQPVIKNNIIQHAFAYTCQQGQQFFQDNLSGKIGNHITTLADNIERAVHDISRHLLRGAVLLTGSLISMYFVHPSFFLGLLVWSVLFSITSLTISKKIVKLADNQAHAESLVTGQLVDSITNTQNIRLFSRANYEKSYILSALNLMKAKYQKKEKFLILFHLFQGFSMSLMLAFMLYMLIILKKDNLITVGDYALILGLSLEVGFTLWWVTEQVDFLNTAVGKANQSLKALFTPIEIQDVPNATTLIVKQGKIEFDSVLFHYKSTEPLFNNKSIIIYPGQKVGLVGYSGSGKTTFVNLILRYYDISSGKILIDDQNIADVTQESLRMAIAMIPQDPSLFHRTLMDNIRYGKIDATDSDVIEASMKAHAHDFISGLPQGYQSLVGERGIKLSGGQRQRIAIARAMLKNAPILILDEATSQLDSITEQDIQDSLWKLMENKTSLVIAHRLSTLLHMDRILVFNKGMIVQDGSHSSLLQQEGLYQSLWNAQVGGFLPDL